MVTLTLEATRPNATPWPTRSVVRHSGPSRGAILGACGWRLRCSGTDTFKLSKDPLFVLRVCDIVELCLHPLNCALLLCVVEKNQIQPLDRTAPILPIFGRAATSMTYPLSAHERTPAFLRNVIIGHQPVSAD